MAHLRLVGEDRDPPPDDEAWVEDTFDLPGLPPPTPCGADADEPEPLPDPDPRLMTLLEAVDDLFDGHTPQERARIGQHFYFDAQGAPRTRHGQLRVV